ncbi:DUF4199 domain-containing protein [Ferruginibacter albus]|uniref:DUF4199 domain-containing protein n=1 Tax=Ferruginibacter albus TaxID=2875540 RepID=UPI001CC41A27|nr:DUF4199 domain-containing protein [Ferruginibacter albus]UAY53645.1 DUF4199 domain-containing protein [Ferruginibacter albus]
MNINATKKGLIAGCLIIACNIFFFYSLKQASNPFQFVVYILFVAAILWSIISFSKTATAESKLKDYFSQGFKTFIVITLLLVVYSFIFYKLHPEIIEQHARANSELFRPLHTHTEAEIAENEKQYKSVFIPLELSGQTFSLLLSGSIVTLLSSVIIMQLKKK